MARQWVSDELGGEIAPSGLGRTRWVVEGSLSWFNNNGRPRLCPERSRESLLAFHQLAAVLICARKLAHSQGPLEWGLAVGPKGLHSGGRAHTSLGGPGRSEG